ncbi:MAG TPA: protein phosphatase CheZ [Steroidobacteraceae bacterium]|jgi:chemotaxis protein CheZ|nr:protein phosphatase CheZ [Steroidobacteraceae bacterium]
MPDSAAAHKVIPHEHEPDLLAQLASLTSNLRTALDRFRNDSRLIALADKEVPDARQRLNHVLTLTDQAAHRTLDLVEKSGPPAERTAREAAALTAPWERFRSGKISVAEYLDLIGRIDRFLVTARTDSETVRANLAEVLLAQGFQDLTGQIIRGVMKLVAEVEVVLVDLTRLAGREEGLEARAGSDSQRGHGPAVPGVDDAAGVVAGQTDIDALLSDLGI